MQSILRLARWEWFRLHHRAPFLVLASLAFAIPLLSLVAQAMQEAGWLPLLGGSGYFGAAAGSLVILAPILAIVLSSFTHASDLQNGACRTLTGSRRPARKRNCGQDPGSRCSPFGVPPPGPGSCRHFRQRFGPSLCRMAGWYGFGIRLLGGFPAIPGAGSRPVSLEAIGVVYHRGGYIHHFCRDHILSAGQWPGRMAELAGSRSNGVDPLGNNPGAPGRQQHPFGGLVSPHFHRLHHWSDGPGGCGLPQVRPSGRQRLVRRGSSSLCSSELQPHNFLKIAGYILGVRY